MCDAGLYSIGKDMKCKLCGYHFYNDQPGSTTCKECPPDEVSINKRTGCAKCQPGYYFDDTIYKCRTCPENTISKEINSRECISCGEDQHTNIEKTECLPGKYVVKNQESDFLYSSWGKHRHH